MSIQYEIEKNKLEKRFEVKRAEYTALILKAEKEASVDKFVAIKYYLEAEKQKEELKRLSLEMKALFYKNRCYY